MLRFIEEAQITGQLAHPNIVPVYELGVDENDQLFYTMKFVRGVTLRKVLELLAAGEPGVVKKYPLPALLTISQKLCDAIAFAHSKGVIHRDLKPENVMLDDFGVVRVMDWGLAKVLAGKAEGGRKGGGPQGHLFRAPRSGIFRPPPSAFQTLAGSIMGTPAYMSPEQARGEIDALGAILFEILHLHPAYAGSSAMEIVNKVGRGEVLWSAAAERSADAALADAGGVRQALRKRRGIPPGQPRASGAPLCRRTPNVPASLLAVLRKAMALDEAARYRRVEDLQAAVLAYQNGFATSAEKAGLAKQLGLLIRRHKGVAATAFAAWLVVTALAIWFLVKVTHERNRAERALADLKKQAPGLRQFAESEALAQRLESALEKLDASITLDPAHLPSYWRRAWLLIGLDGLPDAADALRLAQKKDPAHGELAAILPTVEKLAPLSPEFWATYDAEQK